MEQVLDAIEYAVKAHRGQFRKGTKIPYIVHPLGVVKILIEYGYPSKLVVAGALHDVLEDTSETPEKIKDKFGEEVLSLVIACSEPDKSKPWKERKTHTIEEAKKLPLDVLRVECSDKLDNIRAIDYDYSRIEEDFWQRLSASKDEQKWYYSSLAEVFVNRMESEPDKSLSSEFAEQVRIVFGV